MFQDQRPSSLSRKVQDQARKRKRNRRRKKSISNAKGDEDVKSESTEITKVEAVEPPSIQTQENVPAETQHVDHQAEDNLQTVGNGGEQRHKDAKMVQAQTQTKKLKGVHRFTQTPVVLQNNQETQTDLPVGKQDNISDEKTGSKNAAESQLTEDKHTPEPKLQDDNSAQTPLRQNEGNDGASSDSAQEQNPKKEENPSVGTSVDPTDSQTEKGAKPKSYAKVVSGEGGGERQSNMDASKSADKTTKPSQNSRSA